MGKKRKGSGRSKRKAGSSKASSNCKTSAALSQSTPRNRSTRSKGKLRKAKEHNSSTSETSPFKGFNLDDDTPSSDKENFDNIKLNEDGLEIVNDKNTLFDSLLDPHYRSHFSNKKIRTYSNKKRSLLQEKKLLEFQDCKTRDSIIQWLTDTHNVFDRLTQTQCSVNDNGVSDNDQEVPLSLDMPSISQIDTRMTRSTSKSMRTKKKLRARSLDIKIKKNGNEGRSKRHSLAGDTPSMENYHIEESVTDEEVPVPAEKIIVDLMEDEYLNNIEKEMMEHMDKGNGKKNQSVKGWDRMKDFNKSINISKKKPKQLEITTLHGIQNKKGGNVVSGHAYNFDELENYFIENMEKLIAEGKSGYPVLSAQETQKSQVLFTEDAINTGNSFVALLKDLSEKADNRQLNELEPVIAELKEIFNKLNFGQNKTCDTATQTNLVNQNQEVQTEIVTTTVEIQTEDLYKCQNCANVEIIKSNKRPDLLLLDKFVQTENQICVDVPANPEKSRQIVQVVTESTTPSGLSSEKDLENFVTPPDNISNHVEEKIENELESLDVCFNTEDIIKAVDIQENVVTEKEQSIRELDNRGSDHINEGGKGVKRLLPKSPHSSREELQPKRPCNRFINEDLSIDFMSCAEAEETSVLNEGTNILNKGKSIVNEETPIINKGTSVLKEEERASNIVESRTPNEEVIVLSESSDDAYFEQYLDQMMKKFENDVPSKSKIDSAPTVNKSQEQIEEYEALIRNATKPGPSAGQNKQQQQQQRPSSHANSDTIFEEAERTLTELEIDLDYFKTEKTPKSSRKCLFNSEKNQAHKSYQFSESLFFSEHDETLIGLEGEVANRTITQDNVDAIVEEIRRNNIDGTHALDNEVEDILKKEASKINIIQNIVVKSADCLCTPNEEGALSEDVDIVESTPQKKFGSFSNRAESVLDITLPPPLEFQDTDMVAIPESPKQSMKKPSPLRPPLKTINKITSTPITQNRTFEKISLSPISLDVKRNLNPIEIAQRSKFSPLSIVKKTPSQKSFQGTPKQKSQKSILNYMIPSQESQEVPQTPLSRPCVSCSRISRDQVMGISAMANKKLISYSSTFSPKVTHLIVSADSRNRLKEHTIKSVSAIAAGIWVLNYGWVRECLAKNCIIPEEPYEVLDFSGIPGPKMARLHRKTNPLLKGFKVHVLPPFQTIPKKDLENILTMLGARVVDSLEDLLDKENYICLVIGDRRPTEECPVDMFDGIVEVFKVITVDVDWLSRSVGQYSLHGLRPFTLCSEDDIDNLGYPPELLSDSVSISLLQSTSSVPSL